MTIRRPPQGKPTPGPYRAVLDIDGRHQTIPIMSDADAFKDDETWPYHPRIGGVYHGRGNAPREVAEATARLLSASWDMYELLVRIHDHAIAREGGYLEAWEVEAEVQDISKRMRAIFEKVDGDASG